MSMRTLSVNDIIEEDLADILKRLGRSEWLTWQDGETERPSTAIEIHIEQSPYITEAERDYLHYCMGSPAQMFVWYAKSKWLLDGPKVLRPSVEQCNALRHVDVTIPIADYRQPFPAVLIELPEQFRHGLSDELQVHCPSWMMLYHDPRRNYIISFEISPSTSIEDCVTVLTPRTGGNDSKMLLTTTQTSLEQTFNDCKY